MARKAVLQGGKRDEIINVATKQFFEKGAKTAMDNKQQLMKFLG